MRILSRAIFLEIFSSASLGALLFIFVLFLRTIEKLSVLLVKIAAPWQVVAKLVLYALPATLPFALPLGVLVGILVGLSRMSADSEITAIRAAGVSSLTVVRPVALFAVCAMVITATASLWLTPLSLHLETKVARNFAAAQLTGELEPHIFNEQFPNTVLYVDDVTTAGKQVTWHGVFIADTTSAAELSQQGRDRGDTPRIIVAQQALPHPDAVNNRIILDMVNVHTSERDKEGKVISTSAPSQVEVLQAQKQDELQLNKTVQELDTWPLYKRVYRRNDLKKEEYVDAAIELHQRFALPLACLLLGLVGVPLGISSRKGGKSGAFIMTVLVAFLYYLGFITLIGLARKGSLPVPVAVWMPDVIFAVASVWLLAGLERPGNTDVFRKVRTLWASIAARFSVERTWKPEVGGGRMVAKPSRLFAFRPLLIDGYVLNSFLFYFAILMGSLLLLIEVFTFFELLGDMVKNNITMGTMVNYLWNLAPQLIYLIAPIGTLVASLICFGILTKYNEVTAFKAGGVSLHRLAAPVLVASLILSTALFAFDHYYIPESNRRQEKLRAQIKNKPVATYLRADRQWVYGQGSRIYNYRFLDRHSETMSRVNVYELDRRTFQIARHISAERAVWSAQRKTWIFSNGMIRESGALQFDAYRQFSGKTIAFPELTEAPDWFVKEEKEYKEMNFSELGKFIEELKVSGMDTTPLQVQYYKKFAVPLFTFIMAVISIPFAFVAGNRGAMTGVGISFAIAIAYWSVGTVFEQIGDLNQLPPAMAAWSPDVLFLLAGSYLMARMKT